MDYDKFVFIDEVIPNILLEIRYFSNYNFVGERIDGYEEPYAILTKEAASRLKEVSDELFKSGYLLKIFDAYRPEMAVKHFLRWSKDLEDDLMKKYFYPNYTKKDIMENNFIIEKSSHSRGSTVDLTLFDMNRGIDVDMGSTFDLFDEISYSYSNKITLEQQKNRYLLKSIMEKHGFIGYEKEWWHFTLKDEPYPDEYFNFKIKKG